MVTRSKPDSIMITIRNRKTNKSKSLTVYSSTVIEVYESIDKFFRKEGKK